MALIAGYTLTPAHIGGPWSLTGPYTDAQNTQVLLGGGLGKREAEPEADAYYGLGLGGYGWAGLGGLVAPLAIHRDGPFLCGNGEHLINGLCKKKRSAEAEPEAYYGYGGYGLGYGGYGYGGLGYGYGKRSADADAYYGYGGYGGYGLGYTTGYGLGYGYGGYGKRSADSEADAYYGYGGYGGYGLGYGGYGYGGLGYGYGKRSADADAYYGYGGYGLGLYGKSAPCVNAANIPVPCTYGKRSADAKPYYGYGGAYTGYGYGGYGLGLGYGYGK